MPVNLGSAEGRLTLNASDFVNQINSAIAELESLRASQAQTVQSITELETGLVGAGSSISGSFSGISGSVSDSLSSISDSAQSSSSTVSDSVSGIGTSLGETSEQTRTFGDRVRTAFQHLRDALPDVDTVTSALDGFGKKAVDVGKKLSKYITTPLTGLGVYSVKTSMSFEKAMSQVQATMGATKNDMGDLEAAAKEMGETTQFTNVQAAEALNYLALAGYNSEQMIAALPSVLNLAAAGGMDLAYASDMLTDGLSALNLASRDSNVLMSNMNEMVDKMAKTASSSNTSVSQLGDAILTVGGTASYLSGGLTEINQVIGLMADRGIKASEAGTHLRNIILAMQPATDDAKKAFVKVGLGIRDANGEFQNLAYDADGAMKPMQEIFGILQEGMKNMSDQEKQGILADIFHRTDLAAAQALIGTTTDRWNELSTAIDNAAGAGSQMAATQLDNLSGKMTLLKSQADAAATSIGETLSPEITKLIGKVSDLISKFSSLNPETQTAIIKFGVFAAAIGPVLTAIGKMSVGLSAVIKVIKGLGNALAAVKASSLFTSLATGFSKLGTLATSAVSKIGASLTSGLEALAAPATASLGTVFVALLGFIAGYGIGTLIYDAIGDEIDEVLHPIFDGVVGAWEAAVEFFTESVPETLEEFFDFVVNTATSVRDTVSGFIETVQETVEGAIESVVNFVSDVSEAISGFFSTVWETLVDTFTGISTWIDENVIQPVLDVVVPIVSKIGEIIAKIWEIITTLFSVAVDWISDNVIQPIVENTQKFVNKVKTGVQTLINTIQSWINSFLEFVSGFWSEITSTVSTFVTFVKTKFTEAYNVVVGVFNRISSWWQKNVVDPITQKVQDVKDSISTAFTNAWEIVTDVFDDIGSWFADKWSAIVDVFSGTVDFFSDVFSEAWDSIADAFEDAEDFFSDLWDSIVDTFEYAADVVSDTFENAFTGAFNGVMSMVEDLINTVVDAINSAVDLINEIPGVDIDTIDRLSLPRLAVGLDYVPYDGYQALLHKGERVLTKEENEEYNHGTQGGDTFIFNSPEPIDEVTAAQEMKRIKQELAEGF